MRLFHETAARHRLLLEVERSMRRVKPTARSRAVRLGLLISIAALLSGAVHPEPDGQMLQTSSVSFTSDQIEWLETIEPKTRAILEQVEIQSITYASGGLHIEGYLARPRVGVGLPCVIYNRGGNRSFGALDDAEAVLALGPIALAGYVVVASQYRGAFGSEGRDEFGGADVDDVLNLIPLLDSLPATDASRIGMVGWSRGGMMTYLALARTDRVAAAIVGAGASNLSASAHHRPELDRMFHELIPNYGTESERQLAARSAVRWPERLHKRTPILILHGGADWRVDPRQALTLAEKLVDVGHPFRLVFFGGGDHGLTAYRSEVQGMIHAWLDRYVRQKGSWPSPSSQGS